MYSPFTHPDKVIARGSAILSSLFIATLISSYATVDAAVRENVVNEYLVNPSIQAYNSFVAEIEKQLEEDAKAKKNTVRYESNNFTGTDSATIRVETNVTTTTNDGTSTPTQQRVQYNVQTPVQQGTTAPTTQLNDNWEAEAAAKQAQQRAEYEAAAQKSREEYEARVREMQSGYNTNVDQMNREYEEAVKQNQAEFDAFKAENGM